MGQKQSHTQPAYRIESLDVKDTHAVKPLTLEQLAARNAFVYLQKRAKQQEDSLKHETDDMFKRIRKDLEDGYNVVHMKSQYYTLLDHEHYAQYVETIRTAFPKEFQGDRLVFGAGEARPPPPRGIIDLSDLP